MKDKYRNRILNQARTTARKRIKEINAINECYVCGHNGRIDVHHIDGNPLNNHLLNLIPLCHQCHRQVHSWQQTISNINQMKTEFEALTD